MKPDLDELRTQCHSARTVWQSILGLLGVLLWLASSSAAAAADVVRAELGKETAWTGEAVPMIVTLYSPGPFSGTASFELPDLPKTTFVRAGNPLVGSEQIDDETYFTQRHEFTIYTQRAGEIVVPPFQVRFAGKQSFTSAAEPMEGLTQELRFQSKQPPGTEHLGLVVAAKHMKVSQSWQPATIGPVQAGDVITRTISRRATDTTAMMLPPISNEVPAGVRYYATDPVVKDFTERGASQAERTETLKYQFERPGTFQLPDLLVTWWDSDVGELKRETLAGETIHVAGTVEAEVTEVAPLSRHSLVIFLLAFLAIGLAAWLGQEPVRRFMTACRARRNNAEALATKRLRAACRRSDAPRAYAALNDWRRAVSANDGGASLDRLLRSPLGKDLQREWTVLSRRLYGIRASDSPWSGRPLAEAFAQTRRRLTTTAYPPPIDAALPPINPTDSAK